MRGRSWTGGGTASRREAGERGSREAAVSSGAHGQPCALRRFGGCGSYPCGAVPRRRLAHGAGGTVAEVVVPGGGVRGAASSLNRGFRSPGEIRCGTSSPIASVCGNLPRTAAGIRDGCPPVLAEDRHRPGAGTARSSRPQTACFARVPGARQPEPPPPKALGRARLIPRPDCPAVGWTVQGAGSSGIVQPAAGQSGGLRLGVRRCFRLSPAPVLRAGFPSAGEPR